MQRPGIDHLKLSKMNFLGMRMLIAGAPGRAAEPPSVQKQFVDTFLAPWVERCCDAITQCSVANYYRRVAEFTCLFVAVERDSLAID